MALFTIMAVYEKKDFYIFNQTQNILTLLNRIYVASPNINFRQGSLLKEKHDMTHDIPSH